jgi:hypothetical protein
MDADTFDWLGAVVDNLILISAKTGAEPLIRRSIELKNIYFDEGVKRLSGGINNTLTKDLGPSPKTVITTSFVIQYVKFSATNLPNGLGLYF